MNHFFAFILSWFLLGGVNEVPEKPEPHGQGSGSGIANARATSVYVSGRDVYVVGYKHAENSKTVATLWKNGIEHDVSDGTNHAFALSVFVYDSDVYVAGYESSESPFLELASGLTIRSCAAKLWKNGVAQNLSNEETKYAMAHSVFVSDGDVYVAGSEVEPNGQDSTFTVAKLWINGVAQDLSDSGGTAHSVFVSGSDVYVAGSGGYESPSNSKSSIAKLWKNGVAQNLSDETKSAWAHSVYVSGNDVYAAGVEYQEFNPHTGVLKAGTSVLWKNGIAQYLDLDVAISRMGCSNVTGSANSVCISESGDVYVAGYAVCSSNGSTFSVLWKNGIVHFLNRDGTFGMVEEMARYNSVFVSGEDVYVAGSEDMVRNASIWKNGVLQELTNNPPIDYDKIIIR